MGWIYVWKMALFKGDLWRKVMGMSILKEENWDGVICGDLEKEYLISLGRKEKQGKDCGEIKIKRRILYIKIV